YGEIGPPRGGIAAADRVPALRLTVDDPPQATAATRKPATTTGRLTIAPPIRRFDVRTSESRRKQRADRCASTRPAAAALFLHPARAGSTPATPAASAASAPWVLRCAGGTVGPQTTSSHSVVSRRQPGGSSPEYRSLAGC